MEKVNVPKLIRRVTQLTVLPENEPIFSELATKFRIADEAAGEFLVISQDDRELRFNREEWDTIDAAARRLFSEMR